MRLQKYYQIYRSSQKPMETKNPQLCPKDRHEALSFSALGWSRAFTTFTRL